MNFLEDSFEDIDSTITRELRGHSTENSGVDHNHQSTKTKSQKMTFKPTLAPVRSSLSSAATSETGTLFSDSLRDPYYQYVKPGSEGSVADAFNEEEEDDDFLSDFHEFQNKKDNFDEAIKTHFNLRSGTGYQQRVQRDLKNHKSLSSLHDKFTPELNHKAKLNNNASGRPRMLRQPQSMLELKQPYNQQYTELLRPRYDRFESGLSSTTIRQPNSSSSVRFKKSMPSLTGFSPLVPEERAYSKNWLEDKAEINNTDDYSEDIWGQPDGERLFINRPEGTVKLSSGEYDVVKHDNLLTPRLHKRSKERPRHEYLDSFIETEARAEHRKVIPTAKAKMKTIKQQIDHNTPIREGRMYYNPKSMRWEGNENVLDKFRDVDSNDNKPLLIRKKSSLKSKNSLQQFPSLAPDNATNENASQINTKDTRKPKVVGKMMFDEKNLRWVSLNEEEIDPFASILEEEEEAEKDNNEEIMEKQGRSDFPIRSSTVNIGIRERDPSYDIPIRNDTKLNNRRFHSVGNYSANYQKFIEKFGDIYQFSSKDMDRFYREEKRWQRKVGGWFTHGDADRLEDSQLTDEASNTGIVPSTTQIHGRKKSSSVRKGIDTSYMYEIRKMVLNSTRN